MFLPILVKFCQFLLVSSYPRVEITPLITPQTDVRVGCKCRGGGGGGSNVLWGGGGLNMMNQQITKTDDKSCRF